MIRPLRRFWCAASSAAALALTASAALAAWPPDGVPLANSPYDEHSPVGMTGPDGDLFVFWIAGGDPNYGIFAQQLTQGGAVENGWSAGGRGVVTSAAIPGHLWLTDLPDATGGAILAWFDHRAAHGIYAVRVNSLAVVMPGWSADGTPVCTFSSAGDGPMSVCPDGAGGAYIAWVDTRRIGPMGPFVYDVFGQHILDSGLLDPAWPADGRALVTGAGYKYPWALALDGFGGFWLASEKADDTSRLSVTHFSSGGDSIASWSTPSYASYAVMTRDGGGGVFFAWKDCRACTSGTDGVYAVRLTGTAVPASGWPAGGVEVSGAADPGDHDLPVMTTTGDGAAMIAWRHHVTGVGESFQARRIEGGGTFNPGWSSPRTFATIDVGFEWPLIVPDRAGGALFAFRRNTPNVFGSRVDVHAIVPAAFPDTGLALCSLTGHQDPMALVSDGLDGAYVMWEDTRYWPGNGIDVYAMRFTRDGEVGGTGGIPSGPGPVTGPIALSQPVPNPATGPATFVLVLAEKSSARIEVLDLSGRVIQKLWDGTLGSGPHNFYWNGSDDDGREMPAGVYLVRAAAASNHAMQRIVRLR